MKAIIYQFSVLCGIAVICNWIHCNPESIHVNPVPSNRMSDVNQGPIHRQSDANPSQFQCQSDANALLIFKSDVNPLPISQSYANSQISCQSPNLIPICQVYANLPIADQSINPLPILHQLINMTPIKCQSDSYMQIFQSNVNLPIHYQSVILRQSCQSNINFCWILPSPITDYQAHPPFVPFQLFHAQNGTKIVRCM